MSAPTPSVALVRVEDISFHPHNVRQDLGDLRTLTASIRRHGVMQPVVVEKYAGRLRLRAGHRRVASARIAGLARVPAVIDTEALDDDEWLIASVQENVIRAGLSDQERNRTVQALLDLGCSWDGIAETFGVHSNTVHTWMSPKRIEAKRKSHAAHRKVYVSTLRRLVDDWRTRDLDRDAILAELDRLVSPPAGSA